MRRLDDRPARRRAVLAVAALYALLLQAFLGALHPMVPFAVDGGAICAQHEGGAPGDDGAPCPQHACCIPAQAARPPTAFASSPAEMPAPPRRSIALVWRTAAPLGPRAPPDPAVSPRGPPTA